MGKIIYTAGKPCKCGCGNIAERHVSPTGRNVGWYRYAKGHQPRPSLCDPKVREKCRAKNWSRKPLGSRRTKKVYGKLYWEIKVIGQRRWPSEHRVIMERKLGRKLKSNEHVHHIDGNGLNNKIANLMVLTGSEHRLLENKLNPTPRCKCTCPHCGARLTHFKKTNKRHQ